MGVYISFAMICIFRLIFSRTRSSLLLFQPAFSLVCFFPGWLPSQIETWNFPNLVVWWHGVGKSFHATTATDWIEGKTLVLFLSVSTFPKDIFQGFQPYQGPQQICPIKSQWMKISKKCLISQLCLGLQYISHAKFLFMDLRFDFKYFEGSSNF